MIRTVASHRSTQARVRILTAAAGIVSLVLLHGLVSPAAPAHAGGCTLGICSQTSNRGGVLITAGRDYASNGKLVAGSPTKNISPGYMTPAGEDWDAFLVPAGACAIWKGTLGTGGTVNRVNSTNLWVKISNGQAAGVKLKWGGCPTW